MISLVGLYYLMFLYLMIDLARTGEKEQSKLATFHALLMIACLGLPVVFLFHCLDN